MAALAPQGTEDRGSDHPTLLSRFRGTACDGGPMAPGELVEPRLPIVRGVPPAGRQQEPIGALFPGQGFEFFGARVILAVEEQRRCNGGKGFVLASLGLAWCAGAQDGDGR